MKVKIIQEKGGERKMGYKIRCTKCNRPVIIKSGSLDKKRKVVCRCGWQITIEKKENGKFMIS
jgi:DNA-directed RNA polymerase subunit RPC12/RpoP